MKLGLTKRLILLACERAQSWTKLRTITGKSEPTLMVHLKELVAIGYLKKNELQHYECTLKGRKAAGEEGAILEHFSHKLEKISNDLDLIKMRLGIKQMVVYGDE